MKERPILLNGAMVRALLDGTKTQTRRMVKGPIGYLGGRGDEADLSNWGWFFDGPDHHGYMVLARGMNQRHDHGCTSIPCPYGQPGDRLWVRETWGLSREASKVSEWIRYAAGGPPTPLRKVAPAGYSFVDDGRRTWRPSIHMPRWASRLTMEVTEVRVQRLCEISEEDARAEGVEPVDDPFQKGTEYWRCYETACVKKGGCAGVLSTRTSYETLWDSINGTGSWDLNPWVWAISFRRLP